MRPVSAAIVSRVCRINVSSSGMMTNTVSSVVTAGSAEDLSTTGENDGHASRLEEVLVRYSVNDFELPKRETYMIP